MPLGGLQHYTIEPQDLERTKNFYVDVLGLEIGDRPPLDFPGYWLYSGGQATVHLMGTRKPREGIIVRGTEKKYEDTGRLDHIAFAATDVDGDAQAPAGEERQIPREHRAAHRRYAVLPLRSRWRRRGAELPEAVELGCASKTKCLRLALFRHQFGRPRAGQMRIRRCARATLRRRMQVPQKAPSQPSLRPESVSV